MYNFKVLPPAAKWNLCKSLVLLSQAQADSIVQFLSDENLVKQLKQEKAQNLPWLQREHNIGSEQIDALYQYAKFQFDCGNYSEAAEFLYHYRTLSTNSERNLNGLFD